MIAGSIEMLAEAMTLAEKSGIPRGSFQDLVGSFFGTSGPIAGYCGRIAADDFAAGEPPLIAANTTTNTTTATPLQLPPPVLHCNSRHHHLCTTVTTTTTATTATTNHIAALSAPQQACGGVATSTPFVRRHADPKYSKARPRSIQAKFHRP
jgi:hypothetical protein